MGGNRIKKAKEALIFFLKSLPEGSYFNVYSFGNSYKKLFEISVKYEGKNINTALKNISEFDSNMGGTEIYSPLKEIFDQPINKTMPK